MKQLKFKLNLSCYFCVRKAIINPLRSRSMELTVSGKKANKGNKKTKGDLMTTLLERAEEAVKELRKAIAEGKDINADASEMVKQFDNEVLHAQMKEIQKSIADLKKQEEDKPEPEEEKPEPEDETKALLNLALDEIVRLQKQNEQLAGAKEGDAVPKAADGAEALRKQENGEKEEEEVEKAEGASEPGPAADLPKPESDDYTESAEGKGGSEVSKQEGDDEENKEDMEKAIEQKVQAYLKQAGFVASTTPIRTSEPRGGVASDDDLTKAYDKLLNMSFKEINRFRMEVDPSLKGLSQFTMRSM